MYPRPSVGLISECYRGLGKGLDVLGIRESQDGSSLAFSGIVVKALSRWKVLISIPSGTGREVCM